LNSQAFIDNPDIQNSALIISANNYLEAIKETHGDKIGTEIEGKPITLSGLLGVVHVAGIAGLNGWLSDEKQRQKFTKTTEMFHKTTGIF
jgi:hypothetical protein